MTILWNKMDGVKEKTTNKTLAFGKTEKFDKFIIITNISNYHEFITFCLLLYKKNMIMLTKNISSSIHNYLK